MNEIGNKFILAGDKFMPEMYSSQDLHIKLVGHLQKTWNESKNLKKQEIHDIFIKMNQIKHVFNMIQLMEILKT